MAKRFGESIEKFRQDTRLWLESHLVGKYKKLRGRGGPGDDEALFHERLEWEQLMAKHGWTCLGWPEKFGGRQLNLLHEVVFNEEYARIGGPGRLNHIGETLLGPTLIEFGTEAQKQRFLPKISKVEELWCQGYSEPNAGSDLANVQTRAHLENEQWVIEGQKVWTSHAHDSQWCFVLCRTDCKQKRHRGLSYLLVPMEQSEIEIRPIRQLTGTCEFNEVFFNRATTDEHLVVGEVNDGWRIAMATLAYERGTSTLGQQLMFEQEYQSMLTIAQENGSAKEPHIRQRLADCWIELKIMRFNAIRTLSGISKGKLPREAMMNKLYWANLHKKMGELAMEILGPEGMLLKKHPYGLTPEQRLFLFSRSDTIYAGSDQIQRNIIGERALGLPKEPKVTRK